MYTFECQDDKLYATFSETLDAEQARQFRQELKTCLSELDHPTNLVFDRRKLEHLAPQAIHVFVVGEELYKTSLLRRVAILKDSSRLETQLDKTRLSDVVASKIRYIDAARHDDWRARMKRWLEDGVEPSDSPPT